MNTKDSKPTPAGITAGITIGIAVAATIAIGWFAVNEQLAKAFFCVSDPSIHDSAAVRGQESRELLAAMTTIYSQASANPSYPNKFDAFELVRPLNVISISNRVATVRMTKAYDPGGGGEYAEAWTGIFRKHHPERGRACASIEFVWTGGAESAQCCNTPL